ncbi:galactokinase [soil metagenome]
MNLIGEHTDYNGGLVLPMTLPQRTEVELEPRNDLRVTVWSEGFGAGEFHVGGERRGCGWLDRVQGCTAAASAAGHAIGGFDARIRSTVPVGAGVASSAALGVSLLRALRSAYALTLDDLALALLAQQAEREFTGVRVGIMDQLAASLGAEGIALLIDTSSFAVERVSIPPRAEVVVIDSAVSHDHAHGEYNRRRAECEAAAQELGVRSLREVPNAQTRLGGTLGARVRHVVSENARVLATVEALRAGDLELAGVMLRDSHRSLRDDYEVSSPELDALVALAEAHPDTYGARMTGGGFGGSIVALAARGAGEDVAKEVVRGYRELTGLVGRKLLPV